MAARRPSSQRGLYRRNGPDREAVVDLLWRGGQIHRSFPNSNLPQTLNESACAIVLCVVQVLQASGNNLTDGALACLDCRVCLSIELLSLGKNALEVGHSFRVMRHRPHITLLDYTRHVLLGR